MPGNAAYTDRAKDKEICRVCQRKELAMKIVIWKSPRLLVPLLRGIFHIRKS